MAAIAPRPSMFPVSLVLPAGSLWANCKCRRRVPDPQITRAQMRGWNDHHHSKKDSQRDKQYTRGFAGCSVQCCRVVVVVVVVLSCQLKTPKPLCFKQDSDGRQFEELRQRKRSS